MYGPPHRAMEDVGQIYGVPHKAALEQLRTLIDELGRASAKVGGKWVQKWGNWVKMGGSWGKWGKKWEIWGGNGVNLG